MTSSRTHGIYCDLLHEAIDNLRERGIDNVWVEDQVLQIEITGYNEMGLPCECAA